MRISNGIAFLFLRRPSDTGDGRVFNFNLRSICPYSGVCGANRAEKRSHLFISAIKSNEAWNSTLKAASSALNFGIDFGGWNRMFIQHPSACQVYEKSGGEVHLSVKAISPRKLFKSCEDFNLRLFRAKGYNSQRLLQQFILFPPLAWLWRFICSHAAFRKLENSARFVTEFNWLSPRWKKTFLSIINTGW